MLNRVKIQVAIEQFVSVITTQTKCFSNAECKSRSPEGHDCICCHGGMGWKLTICTSAHRDLASVQTGCTDERGIFKIIIVN